MSATVQRVVISLLLFWTAVSQTVFNFLLLTYEDDSVFLIKLNSSWKADNGLIRSKDKIAKFNQV